MTADGHGFLFGVKQMFWSLPVVIDVQFCEHSKHHLIVHCRSVNFVICELYLSKAVSLKSRAWSVAGRAAGRLVRALIPGG